MEPKHQLNTKSYLLKSCVLLSNGGGEQKQNGKEQQSPVKKSLLSKNKSSWRTLEGITKNQG